MKISFIPKQKFFTADEQNQIVEAIRQAEMQTSGEIRLYVESRCRFVNPIDRATEIFWSLKMDQTAARNAVLVYLAIKDRQLALYGDKGIHEKVGEAFWNNAVSVIIAHIRKETYAVGIKRIIGDIGDALKTHFPYDKNADVNELPDDIVFGR